MPRMRFGNRYEFVCRDAEGRVRWRDSFENLVPDEALEDVLDVYLCNGTLKANWFIGLKGAGAVAAADTLASHAGWTEISDYTGNRQAWTPGTVADKSVDNSASKASFAITGSVTIAGGFLASAASGTTGILFSAGNFSAPRTAGSGDTVDVTATFIVADDGI